MTAFELWKSGPRHEDYEVWRENVIPRIMEENTRVLEANRKMAQALRIALEELEYDAAYCKTVSGERRVVDRALRVVKSALDEVQK